MNAVRLDIEYVDEPITFSSGGFNHEHDPNPRVGTWRCGNGHEYQSRGLRPCIACTLERQANIKAEQQRLSNSNRQRNTMGNDHHHDHSWSGFGSGPIA